MVFSQLFLITGGKGYFECSSLEGTGLDDIVQAVMKVTGPASIGPQRRYYMISCEYYFTSVVCMVDTGDQVAAAVMLRGRQFHCHLNCQYGLAALVPHQSIFPALP